MPTAANPAPIAAKAPNALSGTAKTEALATIVVTTWYVGHPLRMTT